MFPGVTKHDLEYIYTLLMYSSITIFVLCVIVLISGTCIIDKHPFAIDENFDPGREKRQLQFISTQIGACLNEHAYVSWGFVVAMQIQMLILLYTFLRLIYSHERDHFLCGWQRDSVALTSGSLIILFVYSMVSVVEFRSHTPSRVEEFYHYCSAVTAISVFFLLHTLMCSCTRFCMLENTDYDIFKNYYLALTVVFFILWITHSMFSRLAMFTRLTEWILLFMGVALHSYALFVMQDTYMRYQTNTKSRTQESEQHEEKRAVTKIVIWLCMGFLTSVVFAILSTWSVQGKDSVYLQTGVEFWTILLTTYLAVMWLLVFARLNI